MDEIGIEQARPALGEIVDRARFTHEPTRITRQGKPVAVIVSAEWYQAAIDFIGHAVDLANYEVIHRDGDLNNNDPANLELRER